MVSCSLDRRVILNTVDLDDYFPASNSLHREAAVARELPLSVQKPAPATLPKAVFGV